MHGVELDEVNALNLGLDFLIGLLFGLFVVMNVNLMSVSSHNVN